MGGSEESARQEQKTSHAKKPFKISQAEYSMNSEFSNLEVLTSPFQFSVNQHFLKWSMEEN